MLARKASPPTVQRPPVPPTVNSPPATPPHNAGSDRRAREHRDCRRHPVRSGSSPSSATTRSRATLSSSRRGVSLVTTSLGGTLLPYGLRGCSGKGVPEPTPLWHEWFFNAQELTNCNKVLPCHKLKQKHDDDKDGNFRSKQPVFDETEPIDLLSPAGRRLC